ncbi:MAG: GNAT family protein [Chloroflexota bacterium]
MNQIGVQKLAELAAVLACQTKQVTLPDGATLMIRPILKEDAPRLQALFSRLSPESVYARFLVTRKELPDAEARCLTEIDYQTRMTLLATVPGADGEDVVAIACYILLEEPGVAEAAFIIEDAYQERRLGTLMMKQLAAYAQQQGIHTFQFTLHYYNVRMQRLIRHCGSVLTTTRCGGMLEIRALLTEGESGM